MSASFRYIVVAFCTLAASCSDDVADDSVPVTIGFAVEGGGVTFHCGATHPGLGTSQSDFTLNDVRFYVHDVALLRDDGSAVALSLDDDGVWQNRGVALLDFEDASGPCSGGGGNRPSNVSLVGRAPDGGYDGLRFTVGVPFDQNHQDAAVAESPLAFTSMFWSWQGGYKFIRLEGTTAAGNAHRLHLGSTGCEGTLGNVSSCASPNTATVELTGFDPLSATIVLDLDALLGETDLELNTDATPVGCMSEPGDPDCDGMYAALGLDGSAQSAFRSE